MLGAGDPPCETGGGTWTLGAAKWSRLGRKETCHPVSLSTLCSPLGPRGGRKSHQPLPPGPLNPFPGTPRLATHSQQYAGTIPPFRRTGWNWVSKFSFSHLTPNPHCLQQLCSPAAGRMLSPLQASLKPGRLPHNPALTSHVEAGHPWKGLPTSAVPSGLGRSEENPEPARNSGFATLRHDSSETENEGSILCILLVLCPPSRKSRS